MLFKLNISAHAMLLTMAAVPPIGLGLLKFYLHYNSAFRSGLLDYVVGAGAILGGLFLFAPKGSKVVLAISGPLIAVETLKAIVDYRDPFDVAFCAIAVIYLSIPLLRRYSV